MKNKFILTILLIWVPLFSALADNIDDNTYKTPERLFHIARSANKNLICYDILLENGKWDVKNPLKVYWVNREENPGATNGLNYIQRKLAYGYKVVSTNHNSCVCTLSAYPKRPLTIIHNKSGYLCLVKINNQTAILQSLYVKANPNNSLKVEYVELRGITLSNHRPVSERVKK